MTGQPEQPDLKVINQKKRSGFPEQPAVVQETGWLRYTEPMNKSTMCHNAAAGSLKSLADSAYQRFFSRLTPDTQVLGIRMPALRQWVKSLSDQQRSAFLNDLPHVYTEENQAHILLINEITGFEQAAAALRQFIPYADSWAVTDILNVRAFRQDSQTESLALELLKQDNPWGVRHFLRTDPHLPAVLAACRDHETVSMMTAWYLAELTIHDPEAVLACVPQLEWATAKRLGQKVRDSRRISPDIKNRVSAATAATRNRLAQSEGTPETR